ncbi:hypothetical protein C8J57DRAFT_1490144 [Mycena rebaudengoi]|nr:hypothetical protein C8J57DRAFT_1490144 [Mycena rebaudengoi]
MEKDVALLPHDHAKTPPGLVELRESLAETTLAGPLLTLAKTLDQAQGLLTFIETISERLCLLRLPSPLPVVGANLRLSNLKTLFEFIFKRLDVLGYEEHSDYDIMQSVDPEGDSRGEARLVFGQIGANGRDYRRAKDTLLGALVPVSHCRASTNLSSNLNGSPGAGATKTGDLLKGLSQFLHQSNCSLKGLHITSHVPFELVDEFLLAIRQNPDIVDFRLPLDGPLHNSHALQFIRLLKTGPRKEILLPKLKRLVIKSIRNDQSQHLFIFDLIEKRWNAANPADGLRSVGFALASDWDGQLTTYIGSILRHEL